jgi:hypothetical protein
MFALAGGTNDQRTIARSWHIAAIAAPQNLGRYRTNNGQWAARGPNWSAAFDPTAPLAVHCGKDFDAGFSPTKALN